MSILLFNHYYNHSMKSMFIKSCYFVVCYICWNCYIHVAWEDSKWKLFLSSWYLEPWSCSFWVWDRRIPVYCKWRSCQSYVAGVCANAYWCYLFSFVWLNVHVFWEEHPCWPFFTCLFPITCRKTFYLK